MIYVAIIFLILMNLLFIALIEQEAMKLHALQAEFNELLQKEAELNNSLERSNKELIQKEKQLVSALDCTKEVAEELFTSWKRKETEAIRADSVKRTRATLRGKSLEHIVPVCLADFDTRDIRWIGDPIDFLICANANAIHDGEDVEISKVVLVDVKTGKADLSKIQRRIRDAVVEGRVTFAMYNADTETLREWTTNDRKK